MLANEPNRDITLDLLTQLLQAEVGRCGRPALDVLRGLTDTVECLSVATIIADVRAILVDPVGPEAAQL